MVKNGLSKMVSEFKTDFWNDSCSLKELDYALQHGAVGATTNPVIVYNVINNEFEEYKKILKKMIERNPKKTEDEIAWEMIEYTAQEGAKKLYDIFKENNGKKGRLSIQVNTKFFKNSQKIVEQCERFKEIAPNIQIKIPVTKAGIEAIEEVTYRGISINATVCFSVAQYIAVAEAVERGLLRREKEGLLNETMHPVCTIMVGRIGDWLSQNGVHHQSEIDFAGIAVMKEAYKIYKQRNYRTSLLVAAYRNKHQWLEFVGGDIEMTIPHKWIKLFTESDEVVESRIDKDVDEKIVTSLLKNEDFKSMYLEKGLKVEQFDTFGPTIVTLKQFFEGYDNLIKIIRNTILLEEV